MRWPSRFTPGGAPVPPVPQVSPSLPGSPALGRPSSTLELISDLLSDSGKTRRFVFIVGSVFVIIAVCIAGDCFAIMAAARELKGIPVTTTVSVGATSASVLTLVVTLMARWVRNLTRRSGQSGPSAPPNGTGI